jgi:hypothetical protein
MKDQVQKMKQVPGREKVRMLSIRLTAEEQHNMRLAAVMARKSICNLVRERLADVLVPAEQVGR